MNILAVIKGAIDDAFSERLFVATVTAVSGGIVQIKMVGAQYSINQYVPCLTSYSSPTNADVVLVARIGSGYVVLGKLRTS